MSYRRPRGYPTPFGAYGILADKHATGFVTAQAAAAYADGDTITIAGTTFELDKSGDGVAPGNVDVNITAGWTATQVRDALLAAILEAGIPVWAQAAGATINLVHRVPGQNPAIAGTGGFVGFFLGFAGGVEGNGQAARFGPVRAIVVQPPVEVRAE